MHLIGKSLKMHRETLYSLYTEANVYKDYILRDFSTDNPTWSYLKKMSFVYKGRKTEEDKCAIVSPGMSKYPSVDFIEDYNIPIKNIDVSLAEDPDTKDLEPDTGPVDLGLGYWTKCWRREPNINDKKECYLKARELNHFGFAFSDETNECLVYSGITDPSKIKLDKYNSDARKDLFDPCIENAVWNLP